MAPRRRSRRHTRGLPREDPTETLALYKPGAPAPVRPHRPLRHLEHGAHHHEADETSPFSPWRFQASTVTEIRGPPQGKYLNFALPRNIQIEKTSPNRSGLDRNETAALRRPGKPGGYMAWMAIQIREDTPHRASSVMRQRESPVQTILGMPPLIVARAASKNQEVSPRTSSTFSVFQSKQVMRRRNRSREPENFTAEAQGSRGIPGKRSGNNPPGQRVAMCSRYPRRHSGFLCGLYVSAVRLKRLG
jgi:hypothetical protein